MFFKKEIPTHVNGIDVTLLQRADGGWPYWNRLIGKPPADGVVWKPPTSDETVVGQRHRTARHKP